MVALGGLSQKFKVAGAVDDALNLKSIVDASKVGTKRLIQKIFRN